MIDEGRPAADIDANPTKGFIHWQIGKTVTGNAFFVTQGFREGVSQQNADVFNDVVGVDTVADSF